jgi:hypothetical protein
MIFVGPLLMQILKSCHDELVRKRCSGITFRLMS